MVKIFCIGLHKTGTTTLHKLALNSKLRSIHSVRWQHNIPVINKFDFLCDGGSHYNDVNEFDYKTLMKLYPNCKFIINIRDLKKWIISKCKHIGWNESTDILDEYTEPKHDKTTWLRKSLSNISHFIKHYCDWYIKVINFFMDKKNKAIIVNIEDKYNIDKLKVLLNNPKMVMVHENKDKQPKAVLPQVVLDHIDYEINVVNIEKYNELKRLISKYEEK